MKQLLEPNGLFATPASVEELQTWIDALSNPNEKQLAMTVAMMTWNLASSVVAEATKDAMKVAEEINNEDK